MGDSGATDGRKKRVSVREGEGEGESESEGESLSSSPAVSQVVPCLVCPFQGASSLPEETEAAV